MAEETNNDNRQIGITKIYVKDFSFESPKAPAVFRSADWKPHTDLNLRSSHSPVEGDDAMYEVVLTITVEAKQEDQTMFLAEVQQAGLFQIDGGCRAEPIYEIASPLYEKVEIDLGKRYGRGKTFMIEATNASRKNKYVQKATLNGKELNTFHFSASELLKGGSLVLEMGDEPNETWGLVIADGK